MLLMEHYTDLVEFNSIKSNLVDGKNILSLVEGQFFVPNGESRNKRFYSKQLWEKTLNNTIVKENLSKRLVLGTIGHKTPITEETISDGKISHFMESIWIEGEKGMGRACILNTPAGRVLNTMLQAKCLLSASSRAKGKIIEQNSRPTVDEDTYEFKGFDFVLDPGFQEAVPKLVENHEDLLEDLSKIDIEHNLLDNKNTEDKNMSKELLESLAVEKKALEEELQKALDLVKELTSSKAVLEDKSSLQEEKINTLAEISESLEAYKALGEVKDIEESAKALVEANKAIETFKELGTVEEVNQLIESFESTKKELDESKKTIEEFNALGTVEEVTKLVEFMEEIGTVEEITQLVEMYESKIQEDKEKEIQDLVNVTLLPKEMVTNLISKGLKLAEIKEFVETIKTNEDDKKEDDKEDKKDNTAKKFKKDDDKKDDDDDDKKEENHKFKRSSLSALYERANS